MLRLAIRALRVLVTVAGGIFLLLMPASCANRFYFASQWMEDQRMIYIEDLAVWLVIPPAGIPVSDVEPGGIEVTTEAIRPWTQVVGPNRMTKVYSLPLWLLAFVCLAWPVTSFLLARRRGKRRGFAVEAGGGGPAPGIDPPPRRPDNIPPP